MVTLMQYAAVAALLGAGLPRLLSSRPSRQAVAVAHCAAAGAAAAELDAVQSWALGSGASPWLLGVQAVCVAVSAAAVLALVRRISPAPLRLSLTPTAVALLVTLLQSTLIYSAAQAQHGQLPLDVLASGGQAELLAVWAVSVTVSAAVAALAAPVFGRAWRGLGAATRLAVGSAGIGLGGLALDTLITVVGLFRGFAVPPVAPQPSGLAAVDPVASLLGVAPGVQDLIAPGALIVAAVGIVAARLAQPLRSLQPGRRWVAAHVALHRLDPLMRDLLAGAPEWAEGSLTRGWSLRQPAAQLHFRVTTIRDASWSLLGYIDDDALERALELARTHRAGRPQREIIGLAEACWLRQAIALRRAGVLPVAGELKLSKSQPTTPGPLAQEVAKLLAVRRAWSDPLAVEFARTARVSATSGITTSGSGGHSDDPGPGPDAA